MTTHIDAPPVTPPAPLLVRAIQADAAYCAAGGIGAILAAGTLAGWLGVAPGAVLGLGVFLLVYAGTLFWLAATGRVTSRLGWLTVLGNAAWIDGSLLLLFTDWLPLTPAGRWLIGLVGLGVLIFALFQAAGAWQMGRQSPR